ncbi:MAG TPA: type VI secretion system accessory protein TagJ [Steroidobacteraceae bacterium]|jgi:type VI secretion system protein ImpE|nr:type VI secretion system accessory protein TagJ [Steroidobacteraceae bacterium]
MSAAEASFRAGDLQRALEQLQAEVRQKPADAKLRIFLAQLLMVVGQWDRALNQLSVIADLDAGALPMVHSYRSAIQCELLRRGVFTAERSPLLFGDPEPWIALLMQALPHDAQGRKAEAAKLRAEAFEQAPASSGTLNGEAFEWVADADSRLGPMLEVLLNGAYYWVPIHRIQRLVIEAPADARDLVWTPAQFTWVNGGEAMGYIPTRYPLSENSDDDAIRLARKTEWQEIADNSYSGLGQRVLTTDSADHGILDVRELVIQAPAT